jgi:curved DNA-binding protein CbpA
MGPQLDPYRTLGLQQGASEAEVKAAYRRLAKAFHPDTAGEKAIPRFLAIQAAYDALTGHQPRKPRGTAAREPWRADPDRARATRGTRGRAGTTREGEAGPGRQRPAGSTPGGRRPRSSRRGDTSPGKATPGSTTYDAADEPFNPEWSGASWYGTTSGTYWTINPKEYADPRKHGPEYQARARRTWTGAAGSTPVGETAAEGIDNDGIDEDGIEDTETDDGGRNPRTGLADDDAAEVAVREPRDRAESASRFRAAGRDPAATASTPHRRNAFDLFSSLPLPAGFPTRAAIALLGWPPLGFAFATFISEASGCGRFAASCVDTFDVGTWVGQLAIIGLLLALPRLASISAIGTLVMLAAAGPAAIFLSATGGAREREAAAALLTVLLVVAYLAGVVIALARAARTMRA